MSTNCNSNPSVNLFDNVGLARVSPNLTVGTTYNEETSSYIIEGYPGDVVYKWSIKSSDSTSGDFRYAYCHSLNRMPAFIRSEYEENIESKCISAMDFYATDFNFIGKDPYNYVCESYGIVKNPEGDHESELSGHMEKTSGFNASRVFDDEDNYFQGVNQCITFDQTLPSSTFNNNQIKFKYDIMVRFLSGDNQPAYYDVEVSDGTTMKVYGFDYSESDMSDLWKSLSYAFRASGDENYSSEDAELYESLIHEKTVTMEDASLFLSSLYKGIVNISAISNVIGASDDSYFTAMLDTVTADKVSVSVQYEADHFLVDDVSGRQIANGLYLDNSELSYVVSATAENPSATGDVKTDVFKLLVPSYRYDFNITNPSNKFCSEVEFSGFAPVYVDGEDFSEYAIKADDYLVEGKIDAANIKNVYTWPEVSVIGDNIKSVNRIDYDVINGKNPNNLFKSEQYLYYDESDLAGSQKEFTVKVESKQSNTFFDISDYSDKVLSVRDADKTITIKNFAKVNKFDAEVLNNDSARDIIPDAKYNYVIKPTYKFEDSLVDINMGTITVNGGNACSSIVVHASNGSSAAFDNVSSGEFDLDELCGRNSVVDAIGFVLNFDSIKFTEISLTQPVSSIITDSTKEISCLYKCYGVDGIPAALKTFLFDTNVVTNKINEVIYDTIDIDAVVCPDVDDDNQTLDGMMIQWYMEVIDNDGRITSDCKIRTLESKTSNRIVNGGNTTYEDRRDYAVVSSKDISYANAGDRISIKFSPYVEKFLGPDVHRKIRLHCVVFSTSNTEKFVDHVVKEIEFTPIPKNKLLNETNKIKLFVHKKKQIGVDIFGTVYGGEGNVSKSDLNIYNVDGTVETDVNVKDVVYKSIDEIACIPLNSTASLNDGVTYYFRACKDVNDVVLGGVEYTIKYYGAAYYAYDANFNFVGKVGFKPKYDYDDSEKKWILPTNATMIVPNEDFRWTTDVYKIHETSTSKNVAVGFKMLEGDGNYYMSVNYDLSQKIPVSTSYWNSYGIPDSMVGTINFLVYNNNYMNEYEVERLVPSNPGEYELRTSMYECFCYLYVLFKSLPTVSPNFKVVCSPDTDVYFYESVGIKCNGYFDKMQGGNEMFRSGQYVMKSYSLNTKYSLDYKGDYKWSVSDFTIPYGGTKLVYLTASYSYSTIPGYILYGTEGSNITFSGSSNYTYDIIVNGENLGTYSGSRSNCVTGSIINIGNVPSIGIYFENTVPSLNEDIVFDLLVNKESSIFDHYEVQFSGEDKPIIIGHDQLHYVMYGGFDYVGYQTVTVKGVLNSSYKIRTGMSDVVKTYKNLIYVTVRDKYDSRITRSLNKSTLEFPWKRKDVCMGPNEWLTSENINRCLYRLNDNLDYLCAQTKIYDKFPRVFLGYYGDYIYSGVRYFGFVCENDVFTYRKMNETNSVLDSDTILKSCSGVAADKNSILYAVSDNKLQICDNENLLLTIDSKKVNDVITGITKCCVSDDNNMLYVLSPSLHRIYLFDRYDFTNYGSHDNCRYRSIFGGYGGVTAKLKFNKPNDMCVARNNKTGFEELIVCDAGNNCVKRYNSLGKWLGTIDLSAYDITLLGATMDYDGRIHILTKDYVFVYEYNGTLVNVYELGSNTIPLGICAHKNGCFTYVVYNDHVTKYNKDGQEIGRFDANGMRFTSINIDVHDNLYISTDRNIIKYNESIVIVNLSNVDAVEDKRWKMDDIYIHKNENVQDVIFNISYQRMCDNINLVSRCMFARIEESSDGSGSSEIKDFDRNEYNKILSIDTKDKTYVGTNEFVTYEVVNRPINYMYDTLEKLLGMI